MTEYKTNFFGTFLDTMSSDVRNTTIGRALSGSQPSTPPGAADAVLRTLLDRNGKAEAKALLPLTGYSVDDLTAVLNTLASFNLIHHDQGIVTLTRDGRNAAQAKAAA